MYSLIVFQLHETLTSYNMTSPSSKFLMEPKVTTIFEA